MAGKVIDPRATCVIGAAQHTIPPGKQPAPEPLELWATVCQAAAEDAGITKTKTKTKAKALLQAADSLQVVYCQSWSYDDPPGRLAERLRIQPRHQLYSGIGGTTPQLLIQTAAEAIRAGQLDLVILTGAEALETKRQLNKAGQKPDWSFRDPEKKPFPFEAPFHPAEVAHGVFPAWLTFPLFDVARRAHRQILPATYRQQLGDLFAPMTEVAAANPYAWFRRSRSAEELMTPTAANRMVGYPYTKYMVSVMDVDMAAAVIVASHAKADELGVPSEQRVYLRGSCYATDPTYVAEHQQLWRSPAMVDASQAALAQAGKGAIDEVAYLDLYSCFGSSVNLAVDALGIDPNDSRGLTVTGGLPFAGGSGSNYMMHSVATMIDVLRRDPGSLGMVSGVGMHMTKHIFGIYSTTPPPGPTPPDLKRPPSPTVPITDVAAPGAVGTVATYSVVHSRDGEPEWGLVICDLDDGSRCYGRVEDTDLLGDMEANEWVGATVRLTPNGDKVNLATPPN